MSYPTHDSRPLFYTPTNIFLLGALAAAFDEVPFLLYLIGLTDRHHKKNMRHVVGANLLQARRFVPPADRSSPRKYFPTTSTVHRLCYIRKFVMINRYIRKSPNLKLPMKMHILPIIFSPPKGGILAALMGPFSFATRSFSFTIGPSNSIV